MDHVLATKEAKDASVFEDISTGLQSQFIATTPYAILGVCPRTTKSWKKVGYLKLFPATAPIDSFCIEVLGKLVRTPEGNDNYCSAQIVSQK